MEFGISSSCFYPENIEKGFRRVGELGVRTAELFINSPSEMNPPIMNELKSIRDYYGINVRTIHPCTSGFETFFFFSAYDRRRYDGAEFYKRYFDTANNIGAEAVVFHGGLSKSYVEPEFYAECYSILHETAKAQGSVLAHENVREHLCCEPEYMKAVGDLIGDDFRIVLDIKQCRRSRVSEYEFIRLFGDKIVQVHISDYGEHKDCIPPCFGEYDFGRFFSALKAAGYDRTALIELYRDGFGEPEELKKSLDLLNKKFA